ncbi:MAG: serine/threonine protein kinase, partial [Kiritimatiellae bacterium]|nr:serine/threonine protein kinase [Kiritimatiellia bacterium]
AGGGSLLRLMEVHGKNIDPTRVMRICKQVAEGLSCAADQGLVHGDIKPENILFDASGAAKVVDFGLAGMQDENSGDEIWGTPYYIAPEKVRKGATDFRVDMYSLGATIYHALVGEAPFEGTDPNEVVKARFMTDAKPPSEVRPGLPAELDRVILKMMAREVIDRYPTWEACIGDINRVLAAGIVIDESAVAKAELGESASAEEEPSETTSTSSTSVKTGGRRLVMKGRRKMVVKKRTDASTVAEPVETGSQVQADVDGASDLEPADIPSESEVADVAETEPTAPEGKKQMTIGKMIMLGAIAIVAILAVSAGGLVWYMQHSKAVEEQKRMELLAAKTAEAKDAIQTTLKSSRDFADLVMDLRVKSEKQVKDASDAFLAMLDPAVRDVCRPVIIPPETKDYTDAIAYSNKVAEKMAEVAAALEKAAAPVQPEPAAAADTNAPAATPAPATTNAPAAATAPASTNAPAAKPAEAAKPADKKAEKGKTAGKKTKAASAKVAPAPAKAEAPVEVKVEEKKVDYPPQLKAFQQLWTDLWTIRAAEIRVNACMALIAFKASRAEEMKVTDVESAEKLAKATSDLVEEFEVMKSQKVIEQALRKAGAIKQKTPDLLSITKQQIERARARAAKLAAEKAAAEAAEAAKKKAAEEYKAKAEAEIVKAQEKYDALSARELKRLDWDYAMRQMGDLTNGFEKLTREGNQAVL